MHEVRADLNESERRKLATFGWRSRRAKRASFDPLQTDDSKAKSVTLVRSMINTNASVVDSCPKTGVV